MRHVKHLSIDNKSELSNRPHPSLVYAYKPMTIIERTKSSLIQSEAFQAMHNRLQSCLTRMEALFMRHVFKAQKLGYGDDKTEGVWFDADDYTKEEAEAEFRPYQGVTQKGYDYTGYEYDGERYHHYTYLGEFEDNDMPTSDADLWRRS